MDLSRAQIEHLIRKAIPTDRQSDVLASVLPAIGMRDGKHGAEPKAVGTTRFGGRPDLASNSLWPSSSNGPMAFIGQINLTEVQPFDADECLPNSGLLSFFMDIIQLPWGFDPQHREQFAVQFTNNKISLARQDFPTGIAPENRLDRCRFPKFYTRWMLGLYDGFERHRLGLQPYSATDQTDSFEISLNQLDSALTRPCIPVGSHQFLGWAGGLYDDAWCRLRCAAATAGFNCGRGFGSDAQRIATWSVDAVGWRCLLQIRSDPDLYGRTWGDGGTLAVFIRDQDLRALRFDLCWCILGSS